MFDALHGLWDAIDGGRNEAKLTACTANGLMMKRIDVQAGGVEDLRGYRIGIEKHGLRGQIAWRILRVLYQLVGEKGKEMLKFTLCQGSAYIVGEMLCDVLRHLSA